MDFLIVNFATGLEILIISYFINLLFMMTVYLFY